MRLLAGGTLDSRLVDRPLTIDETLVLVTEVGSALEVAHRAGGRPPGREAGQRLPRQRRELLSRRLRHRTGVERPRRASGCAVAGIARLCRTRAAAATAGGAAGRCPRFGHHGLRSTDGGPALPSHESGRTPRPSAQRADPVGHNSAPRAAQGTGRGPRTGDREGSRGSTGSRCGVRRGLRPRPRTGADARCRPSRHWSDGASASRRHAHGDLHRRRAQSVQGPPSIRRGRRRRLLRPGPPGGPSHRGTRATGGRWSPGGRRRSIWLGEVVGGQGGPDAAAPWRCGRGLPRVVLHLDDSGAASLRGVQRCDLPRGRRPTG